MNFIPGLLLTIAAILVARPAYAYLDPSTGSMIVTAIVGLFASIALALKTYWYKLKAFFRGERRGGGSETPKPTEATEPSQDAGD